MNYHHFETLKVMYNPWDDGIYDLPVHLTMKPSIHGSEKIRHTCRLEFYEEITPLVVAAEYGACEVIKVGKS